MFEYSYSVKVNIDPSDGKIPVGPETSHSLESFLLKSGGGRGRDKRKPRLT
jgi:hypothetical protein